MTSGIEDSGGWWPEQESSPDQPPPAGRPPGETDSWTGEGDAWANEADSWLNEPPGRAADQPSTVANGFADALAADAAVAGTRASTGVGTDRATGHEAEPAIPSRPMRLALGLAILAAERIRSTGRAADTNADSAAQSASSSPNADSAAQSASSGTNADSAAQSASSSPNADSAAKSASSGRPRNEAPDGGWVTGIGLLQQAAAEAREVARRAFDRPSRFAARTADWASGLPGSEFIRAEISRAIGENGARATGVADTGGPLNRPRRAIGRSRTTLDRVVTEARERGAAAVAESRSDASAFVQAAVSDAIGWAQAQVIPQIVDGLVPHLVDSVVPRIIDGALPDIRARVMPIIIDDLTNDPQIRDLALEQGRGAVGEAAEHLRSTTANADDRVESAFRRLVRGGAPAESGSGSTPAPSSAPSGTG